MTSHEEEALAKEFVDKYLGPVEQAELIATAARIDPLTGRLPENKYDPMCDHCDENEWTVHLMFTDTKRAPQERSRTRRLCKGCADQVLEWI